MRELLRGLLRVGVVLTLAVIFVVSGTPSRTKAAINPQINFQGKLTNTDGTNVTNGTYSIVFSIYTVSSGGANIWTETQASVDVTDGIFRVALGSVTALPGSVDFNTNSLYLGIKVGADAEMAPRVQFTAAPYAFNSDKLGGLASSGFAQLGPSSVQADSSTNSTFFVNKTAAGNLVQLQNTAVDIFTISNSGDITFGQNASHTISVLQEGTNAAGNSLTLTAGQGGAGAGANDGGSLVLQGGAGGGTGGNGGNITLAAGALNGAGAVGSVIVRNPSDSTTAFQIQDSAGTNLFYADASNDRIYVGATAADATGVLLVLDTKNTTADPTGVDGGMYYNSADSKFRCYEGGAWMDCIAELDTEVLADTNPAAFAGDNNTTELFNDATKPAITVRSTTSTVLVSFNIDGVSNTANDAFFAARVVFAVGANPTCAGGTLVGRAVVSGFTTAATHPYNIQGSFIHTPGSAGDIRYTVCSSADAVGTTLTDTPTNVTVSLVELGQ